MQMNEFEPPMSEINEINEVNEVNEIKRHRTLWLSDIHLGTKDCQAHALLDFLAHNEAECIYLVGDIIDGWQLKKRWYWPQAHNDVIQKLLRKARKGTRIVFIPGNHDMFVRDFLKHTPNLAVGGIEVADEVIHTTADGRRIWILHGDLFDGVVQNMQWLAKLGDELYMFALKANRWLNLWRAKMGLEYWSLSQFLKDKVKNAVSYIDDFENAVATEAARRDCQAVLCGHIHKAKIRDIKGVTYLNSGDWVESLTAISEDVSGHLAIEYWCCAPKVVKKVKKPQKQKKQKIKQPVDGLVLPELMTAFDPLVLEQVAKEPITALVDTDQKLVETIRS